MARAAQMTPPRQRTYPTSGRKTAPPGRRSARGGAERDRWLDYARLADRYEPSGSDAVDRALPPKRQCRLVGVSVRAFAHYLDEQLAHYLGTGIWDLQRELAGGAPGTGTFDELCKFHGLPGKPGICGGDVEALAQAGRLEEIHAYNVTDVPPDLPACLHACASAPIAQADLRMRATGLELCKLNDKPRRNPPMSTSTTTAWPP